MCQLSGGQGNWTVVSPGVASVEKSKADIQIRCTKPGWQDAASTIPSNFQGWTVGNLVLGGLIGVGVDAATGAINDYPHTFQVPMMQALGTPAPAIGTPMAPRNPAVAAAPSPLVPAVYAGPPAASPAPIAAASAAPPVVHSVAAEGQTSDGSYSGVSRVASGNCPWTDGVPASFTIVNGLIRSSVWGGTVNPAGKVALRHHAGWAVDGTMTASELRGEFQRPGCIVTFIWRKL
jgi:hypothetical protein